MVNATHKITEYGTVLATVSTVPEILTNGLQAVASGHGLGAIVMIGLQIVNQLLIRKRKKNEVSNQTQA